ncbi:MAG: DUF4426 domain-containing protein [Gammaproteobacteria bacterium]|jgi:hypothetical protein
MNRLYFLLFAVLMIAVPFTAAAEQSVSGNRFTIHYNALNSDMLTPSVARNYNITRSKNRGLINISVLEKSMGVVGKPARADVSVSAINLNGQIKNVDMREINDQGAIYYIGEFPISNAETLKFHIKVTPQGGRPHEIEFDQQFFTD